MSRRQVLLDSIAATLDDLQRMLRRVDETAGSWRASDQWSIKDVIAHLAAVEGLWRERWQRIVAEDTPLVQAFYPGTGEYDEARPLTEILGDFAAQRRETIALLQGLSQRDWGRPFVHAESGPSRLRDQVQAMVTHDNEHLNQIVAIREQLEKNTI